MIPVDSRRVHRLNDADPGEGPVIYWMSRDQRVYDNWAMIYAQQLAQTRDVPFGVVFCLVPDFLGATYRQYDFMLRGLREVQSDLRELKIPFFLLTGHPEDELPAFARDQEIGEVVSDFSPLRIYKEWKEKLKTRLEVAFYEVDAHNIVPCWVASDKLEYAAHTFRPKITKHLREFLVDFPELSRQERSWPTDAPEADWERATNMLIVDRSVEPVNWLDPGAEAGREMLESFLHRRFRDYAEYRNNPNYHAQSDLSPYLHFGQISAQRVAAEAQRFSEHTKSMEAFLEELVVRRELSDNYCYYCGDYDNFDGLHDWARNSLDEHRNDPREYIYSLGQFEQAETHDDLWNAAQKEAIYRGKMHGYMRMYWAKKILEWTATPEEAIATAIYLNDRFELDGRDPNGYTGINWSIGGVHDRPWSERDVYGRIRYMSYSGCERKFDVPKYIESVNALSGEEKTP